MFRESETEPPGADPQTLIELLNSHPQPVQRAGDGDGGFVHHVRVNHRRFQVGVAKERLHLADVVAGFEQMGGEAVACWIVGVRFSGFAMALIICFMNKRLAGYRDIEVWRSIYANGRTGLRADLPISRSPALRPSCTNATSSNLCSFQHSRRPCEKVDEGLSPAPQHSRRLISGIGNSNRVKRSTRLHLEGNC